MSTTLLGRATDRFVSVTARRPTGFIGRSTYREPTAHEQSFALVLDRLGPVAGGGCLEIGCGGGVLLERILGAGAQVVAGLDHSPDMLALAMARNSTALADDRLFLKLGDAAALPWADQSFDTVCTANVFFFLSDPAAVLAEVFRVLRPGGRFVIATVPGPLPKPSLSRWWVVVVGPSMHVYTAAEMTRLHQAAGFTDVDVTTENGIQISRAGRPREAT